MLSGTSHPAWNRIVSVSVSRLLDPSPGQDSLHLRRRLLIDPTLENPQQYHQVRNTPSSPAPTGQTKGSSGWRSTLMASPEILWQSAFHSSAYLAAIRRPRTQPSIQLAGSSKWVPEIWKWSISCPLGYSAYTSHILVPLIKGARSQLKPGHEKGLTHFSKKA